MCTIFFYLDYPCAWGHFSSLGFFKCRIPCSRFVISYVNRNSWLQIDQQHQHIENMDTLIGASSVMPDAAVDTAKPNCVCNRTIDEYDEDDLMIECDVCTEWFHGQ